MIYSPIMPKEGRERVLHINWEPRPLSSFSNRHLPEFSNHKYSDSEGFQVMRRELPPVRKWVTSYTPIEEVDVFDGTVIAHRILTQTGRVQSIKGSRAADLVARIRRGKVTEAAV